MLGPLEGGGGLVAFGGGPCEEGAGPVKFPLGGKPPGGPVPFAGKGGAPTPGGALLAVAPPGGNGGGPIGLQLRLARSC
jgi:hypothetical protein